MKDLPERYDSNIRFFGKDGQRKLQQTRVTLIGVGGLGSPMAQHLALLGVGSVTLVVDFKFTHADCDSIDCLQPFRMGRIERTVELLYEFSDSRSSADERFRNDRECGVGAPMLGANGDVVRDLGHFSRSARSTPTIVAEQ